MTALIAERKQAEKDLPDLKRSVKDAESALNSAKKPFEGKDLVKDAGELLGMPEWQALDNAGKKYDQLKQQLLDAVTVIGGVDMDARNELAPGVKHFDPSDRSYKASVDRMHQSVREMLAEGSKNRDVLREFKNGGSSAATGNFQMGELLDRAGAKSLVTRGQGGADGLVMPDRRAVVDISPFESYNILDLMSSTLTDKDVIEYPTFLGRTGQGAVIPDPTGVSTTTGVTTKPDIALGWGLVDERMRTIAAGIPAHRNTLDDIPYVQTIIEQQLPLAVRNTLQAQAIAGDGTGENLVGLLNRAGITTVARNSGATEPSVEAIHRTITTLRLTNDEPTCICLNPLNWEQIRLSKTTVGDYYYGVPALAGVPTLWGKLVITDINVPANTAIVADFSHIILAIRSAITLRSSDSHNDFFMKNLVQFLAEGRFGLIVNRLTAVGKTTGLV